MNLMTIVNKLELNLNGYSNLESILKLFDKIYKNKNVYIDLSNDNYCILSIKFINVDEETKYELQLNKHYANKNDKYDILAYEIQLLKNNSNINNNNYNNDKLEQMNNIINELNKKIIQKEKEINNINIAFNEMNNKIINQENKIRELENKNADLINKNEINSEIKKLFNNYDDEIKAMNNKIINLEKDKNDKFNYINKELGNYKSLNEEINKLNLKIKEQENFIKNNDKIVDDILNNIEETINHKINDKINKIGNKDVNQIDDNILLNLEQQQIDNKEIKNIINDNNLEYEEKINYHFKQDPNNLKFKLDLTATNTGVGWNDIFEIFISYKDNKEYLIVRIENYNIKSF